jgi:hypothetical protein
LIGFSIGLERERGERGARDKRGERGEESEESNRVSIRTLSSEPRLDKHIESGTQFAYRGQVRDRLVGSLRDFDLIWRALVLGLGAAQRHFSMFMDCWAGRKSSMLGVWAAPGAREILPKGGGRSPPPFGRVSRSPGAAQTPQSRRSPADPKIMKNGKIVLNHQIALELVRGADFGFKKSAGRAPSI